VIKSEAMTNNYENCCSTSE